MPNPSRDEKADMKAGIIAEHAAAVAVGDDDAAAYIAKVLKDDYGHDVEKKKPARKTAAKKAAAERADQPKPPEDTAEPKPKHKS